MPWGGNNQWQEYTYNADDQRTRRKVDGYETWQIYGMEGELLAEYAANGAATEPQKEYGYRNGELLISAEAPKNVALASNGSTVSVSSTLVSPPYSYPAAAVLNDGDRKGVNSGFGGNWAANGTSLPQWVQVDFNGSKTIREIDVFSLQDNYTNPIEPTETTTFSQWGLTAFEVQYWNGSAWMTVPGGSITGNNKVWKRVTFNPIDTSKIRVVVNATVDSWTRVVEVEAWSNNVDWLVTDHLGTPRMVVDQAGTLATVKRHDYLPFGEELFSGAGGRSPSLGYSADTIRQQFTQKERDVETALDYFGARYYGSVQGRFTGIDPASIMLRQLLNPQDLNRYAYVTNNPLKFIDPDGEEKIVVVVETFIPQPVVEAPGRVLGLNTRYFAGDDRDVGEPGGFRTQQIITVETDPTQNGGKPLVSSSRDIGITSELSGPNGEVIAQGQASGDSLELAVQRDSNGAIRIHAKGDESNPLITSPGITYDLNIIVSSEGTKGNASVQVVGTHDGFPGYEITASRPELQSKPVMAYSYDPRKTGATPYNLFPGNSINVNTKPVVMPAPRPPQRKREKREED